jgi:Fe-S-cluster-containing dehydrogenase component
MTTLGHNAKWLMTVDSDRCSGCQACVVACQAENNIPVSTEDIYNQRRPIAWIRIERYWEVPPEYATHPEDAPPEKVKARFLPMLCQHCENAPCEPVCPVYATYHNNEGLNVQVYNRCIGTRFCANNCPYNVRSFNYWEPSWPESLQNQLNPDVTVRSRGVMEKCTYCVQRIRRGERDAKEKGRGVNDGEVVPACVQACPTDALVFGDIKDPDSKVSRRAGDERRFRLLEEQGTEPNLIYLKKVDPHYVENGAHE